MSRIRKWVVMAPSCPLNMKDCEKCVYCEGVSCDNTMRCSYTKPKNKKKEIIVSSWNLYLANRIGGIKTGK